MISKDIRPNLFGDLSLERKSSDTHLLAVVRCVCFFYRVGKLVEEYIKDQSYDSEHTATNYQH